MFLGYSLYFVNIGLLIFLAVSCASSGDLQKVYLNEATLPIIDNLFVVSGLQDDVAGFKVGAPCPCALDSCQYNKSQLSGFPDCFVHCTRRNEIWKVLCTTSNAVAEQQRGLIFYRAVKELASKYDKPMPSINNFDSKIAVRYSNRGRTQILRVVFDNYKMATMSIEKPDLERRRQQSPEGGARIPIDAAER
tara:strand:- start:661 stop:1236 length:576 start_codon:yes stop_codon:yes gene_type:complete